MKKRLLIGISVLSVILCCIILFAVQSAKIIGEEGLIAKARKEIRNLADAETIEMVVAGKSTRDNNRHLFWVRIAGILLILIGIFTRVHI